MTSSISGICARGVLVASVEVTSVPFGSVPVTVAVLSTTPAFTSARVSVYVAVHVVDSPGASVVTGQSTAPTNGSSTTMALKVTLPLLVTRNV